LCVPNDAFHLQGAEHDFPLASEDKKKAVSCVA
jgi:hypothetical protein